jgi:hypothetical protein
MNSAHVALTFADGTCGVMHLVREEPIDSAFIEDNIRRSAFDADKVPVRRWAPVSPADVPADRTFRNALRYDGKAFSHCPIHSKEIALAKVRVHREPRFAALDAKRMAAGRTGDKALAARLDAEADALANLTEPVKACTTVEELKKTLQTLGVE